MLSISTAYRRALMPPRAVLAKVYAAGLAVNLPILAVLLTPLTRSRVGSEVTMGIGVAVLLVLVVTAVVFAPEVSARVAPAAGQWQFGSARSRTRALMRQDRRAYWLRLAEFIALYVAAQGVGGAIAWMWPHIWRNPEFEHNPAAEPWEFDYPNFAIQAIGIYAVVCLALTWYACRLRQLALAQRTAADEQVLNPA
ncbi:hypothetical protein [Yinghuangia soli]|uniref:Uncharacterized protein n=1 Tax=Yinghuangia soli TaxID=2908204 RepID=A0AA41U4Q6_9ACTN|nr:hypothetical protein [Yinghuangia soli]MCF2531032.1 hypothetical protein [Yinghuangia soli]